MLNETIVMPETDTQNLRWELWGITEENRKEYKKLWKQKNWLDSGVYGLYHRRTVRDSCLYVGASIHLLQRTSRFFRKECYIENPYLHWILEGILQQEGRRHLTIYFYRTNEIQKLGFYEKTFVEKYKPILNLTQAYHKLHPKKVW